jgi:hypothetical protein
MATRAKAKPKPAADVNGVDFAALSTKDKAESGVWFEPNHPETGKPLGARFKVAGEDSSHYVKALNDVRKKRVAAQEAAIADGDETTSIAEFFDLSPEQVRAGEAHLAGAIVLEWEGVLEGGEAMPWKDRFKLMAEHRWLVVQILRFARKRGNFTKG